LRLVQIHPPSVEELLPQYVIYPPGLREFKYAFQSRSALAVTSTKSKLFVADFIATGSREFKKLWAPNFLASFSFSEFAEKAVISQPHELRN
jgi:hypothetical protein